MTRITAANKLDTLVTRQGITPFISHDITDDLAGNRAPATWVYDAANRLLNDGKICGNPGTRYSMQDSVPCTMSNVSPPNSEFPRGERRLIDPEILG